MEQNLKGQDVIEQLSGCSLVGGSACSDTSREHYHATNPATGESLEPAYHIASPDDVDRAVQMAQQAFETYRATSPGSRASFLRAIADNVQGLVDVLVERVGQETALPEPRIRMETGRTANQLRLFADIVEDGSWVDARIDPALPDRQPLPRADIRSMLQPLGPVAVFGASNFPLAFSVAGGDTASALAAGCPVVVKSHSGHPGTSELVGHAVVAAARATGMPDGVFSLLFDNRRDVGIILVEHPLIQAVGFTGSCKVGRHLFDLAAKRDVPIPVYAEMGSINPVFLLPGAIKSRGAQIAEGLCQSVTMGCGQFCTKPGLVFTDGDDDFRKKLGDLIAQHSEGVMLGHRITSGFRESVLHIHGDPRTRAIVDPAADLTGNMVRPCLFETDVNDLLECPALAEEMFGPATLLIRYRSMEELLRVARELPGQLTASIHGTEQELAEAGDLVSILTHRAGRLVFNQFPTGVEVGYAMVHGGPYPATTDSRGTSVGATAILRFARPVCYQNAPAAALPPALRDKNPLGIRRLIDGKPEV